MGEFLLVPAYASNARQQVVKRSCVCVLFTVKSPLFTFLVLIRVNMISTMHSNAECASVQLYHITILHNGM